MKTNQVLTILSDISGPHVARIIADAVPHMSRWRLWRICRKLRHGVPVAKIIHNKWFYGFGFYTNKWTLDPRPDTETLVSTVLDDYKGIKNIAIADLGTGTGCIICAIAKNMPGVAGVALDKSRRALRVARKNVRDLGLVNKIVLKYGDFKNPKMLLENSVDVIVSNPPYIDKNDARVDVGAMHDPKMALFAKHNGLAAYEQIAQNAKIWLREFGRIYLEIGIGMETDVRNIFENNGWKFIKSVNDLGGITRVLVFEN